MKSINIFIQARMSSSRLPHKVLMPILERPMLDLMIERVKSVKNVKNIVVLTSDDASDDAIASFCEKSNINFFRGSLNNVLKRFAQASNKYQADHYIRLTADCPLIDPNIIESLIKLHNDFDYAYTSNIIQRTFPDGMDCEIFHDRVLKKLIQFVTASEDKEHVTLYIKKNQSMFHIGHLRNAIDNSSLRLTVDYKKDFQFIKKIFEDLYVNKRIFSLEDILYYINRFKHRTLSG